MKKLHIRTRESETSLFEVAIKLFWALKPGKVMDAIMAKIGRKEDEEGDTGELQSERIPHWIFQNGGNTSSTDKLTSSPGYDACTREQEEPSSPEPKLREPVLGFR